MSEPQRLDQAMNPVYAELQARHGAQYAPDVVAVRVDRMARGAELRNYARFHCLSVEQAIVELVNHGLSHQKRSWL